MNLEWRSRGCLPHYDALGVVQHIVFCLADALPSTVQSQMAQHPPWERSDVAEAALDAGIGIRLLADQRVAAIVEDALLCHDSERYSLIAWCIMPTHVHVLVERYREWPIATVVQAWKSFTAHTLNRLLERSGPVWFREYFDRAIRDEQHLQTVVEYIERNPVAAGLCAAPRLALVECILRTRLDRSSLRAGGDAGAPEERARLPAAWPASRRLFAHAKHCPACKRRLERPSI